MHDALFVHLARELELPILASDTQLSRAAGHLITVAARAEPDMGRSETAIPLEQPVLNPY